MKNSESKQSFASIRDKILSTNGKELWRSIDEFAETPEFEEFVKREYPAHGQEWNDPVTRRSFLKVMGASLAFAGLTGCVIQPAEKAIPRVHATPGLLPGKPLFFATAMSMGGIATGLLAKSYEGRPIKLEGNPEHSGSLGATDIYAQASLLDMYDPDRSQHITFRGGPKTWLNFTTAFRAAIAENGRDGGAGIRILTETVTSPTFQDQIKKIQAELPNIKWVQYEPVNRDNAMAGARMASGSPAQAIYKFDRAERLLLIDADIFSGQNPRYIADAAKLRTVGEHGGEMSRIYAIETTPTLAGAKADHRLAVRPSQVASVLSAIASAVGAGGTASAAGAGSGSEHAEWAAAAAKDLMASRGKALVVAGDNQSPEVHAMAYAINSALGANGQTVTYTDPFSPYDRSQVDQLRELIADIDADRVKMLLILGGNPAYSTPSDLRLDLPRMQKIPMTVHLGTYFDETAEISAWHVPAKHYLEEWTDSRGYDGTVTLTQPLIAPLYGGKNKHELVQLCLREGFDQKDLDIVKGFWQTQSINMAPAAQPSPATPAATNAAATANTASGAAPAAAASPAAPAATPTPASTPTPSPTRAPSPTPAAANAAAAAVAAPAASPTPAARAGAPVASTTFEDNWKKLVHDGFIPNSAPAAKGGTGGSGGGAGSGVTPTPLPPASGDIEFTIVPDPSIYDGRFANNGWLQELPNPLNKVTWENVALVSPKTAKDLGLNRGNDPEEISGGERGTAFINTWGSNMSADMVTVTYNGGTIKKGVPVWIQPGQPDGVVTLFMGYGRTRAGKIGTGAGYSVFDVQRSDAMNFGTGSIAKTGEKSEIATTQIHFNMMGRDLLRVFDKEVFEATPEKWHQENFADKSMFKTAHDDVYSKQYAENSRWAMTIDLSTCVGCNACVLACQSENNIPVVGKEQVYHSREMHWLRVDSYYSGDSVENPEGIHFQPVLCQQCEQAPCEVVCPVTATAHTPEGLNDMVYNRCVGTRYCSNNCPYKVRRFNFLLYQDWDTPQYKLMRNPEVSVRSRGVMEKCNYCTQRIAAVRIEAQKDGRPIQDGEVLTACQSVCPTGAIVFGDANDPMSKIAASKKDHRNYTLLNELNTQPRTTYLAALKNQNKEMPDYKPLKEPPSHADPSIQEGVPAGTTPPGAAGEGGQPAH